MPGVETFAQGLSPWLWSKSLRKASIISVLCMATSLTYGVVSPAVSQQFHDTTSPRWVLTTWPGKAILAQTQFDGDQNVLLRSIECVAGEANLRRRVFVTSGAVPKSAGKCGIGCRAQLDIRDVPGLIIPDRFVEHQISWRGARRDLISQLDATIVADPWAAKDETSEGLLKDLAAVCRLKVEALTDSPKWLPFTPQDFVASPNAKARGFPLTYVVGDRPANGLPIANLQRSPITQGNILRIEARANVGAALFTVGVDGRTSMLATLRSSDGRRSLFFNLPGDAKSVKVAVRAIGGAQNVTVYLAAVSAKSALTDEDIIDLSRAQDAQR